LMSCTHDEMELMGDCCWLNWFKLV